MRLPPCKEKKEETTASGMIQRQVQSTGDLFHNKYVCLQTDPVQ